jgi:DNA repair protein RecN (Recombination protein N)
MHINNIVLIDDLSIDFEDGLNILTGETGAGKSIIIGSLGIGLGGKFSKELLRDSAKDGLVELLFSVDEDGLMGRILQCDIDVADGEIIISRRLNSSGRTVNKINDTTVTTAKLKEVAELLIDMHAQHEQQTLLKAAKHLDILDDFGGVDISAIKDSVRELYGEYRDIQDKLEKDAMDEKEKLKQQDFLEFQIAEISSAKLTAGEDEELEQQYRKALNSKEILELANEVYEITGYGQSAAGDMIGRAVGNMRRIAELDKDAADAAGLLGDVDSLMNDFNSELNSYMKGMEFDAGEFNDLQTRLDAINSLKSKYGKTIPDILAAMDEFKAESKKLADYDEYMEGLKRQLGELNKKLETACDELSKVRRKKAKELCLIIKESLKELNFTSVEFDMEWKRLDHFTQNGTDEAYFIISTNVGEPLRPLFDVASGGELSRVMLAIKSSLANQDDTPTLIFDEIDVGISGRTAQKVAEKMSVIAGNHQVICITHLPQIAAMADTHYVIEKNVENNKTITNIRKLAQDEEIDEIARLLGGAEITEATILSAKEMKELADKAKLN